MAESKTPPAPPGTNSAASWVTGLRTHHCNELRLEHVGAGVKLSGWVQQSRDMNHFAFVDLRDRQGITQVIFNKPDDGRGGEMERYERARKLGREFVIQITGKVVERINKNSERCTGDIEVVADSLIVLNESKTPPFLIENITDAGEDTRYRYRYLDLRRNPMKEALLLRHKVTQVVRNSLASRDFVEIETPILIKSTPEGARDFVVPSRMNPGQFYALPQSPQTFKQILMVAGMDKYFQIAKCFRDEDLRGDRQPEFTQVDCEMSFVTQDDVLTTFEATMGQIFENVAGHKFPTFPRITYQQAMTEYGIDKPDTRFDMKLVNLTDNVRMSTASGATAPSGLKVFMEAEAVIAICLDGELVDGEEREKKFPSKKLPGKKAPKTPTEQDLEKMKLKNWSKKKIKSLDKLCKSDTVGSPLFWVKCQCMEAGKLKFDSSVKKHYSQEDLCAWAEKCGAKDGDFLCIFAGKNDHFQTSEKMGSLRHLMGTRFGLRSEGFQALWVVDFPLLEWDEEEQRYHAMHHPFTSPKAEDVHLMEKDANGKFDPIKIGKVRANAYDMVINGNEVGGGSIRIHDKVMQHKVFELLGFTRKEAEAQFGFLLGAFEYGAPPHGGLAFGLDRLCTILGGNQRGTVSIRDYIAFPKNFAGRDMMIDAPSQIAQKQMDELYISSKCSAPAANGTESVVAEEAKGAK